MINIIICDDNEFFLNTLIDTVNKFFKNKNLKYKIYAFNDYGKDFLEIVHDETIENKIYILDIETPTSNGIQIAKIIRLKDFNSKLIYISAYTRKYLEAVSKSDTMYIGYLSKKDDYQKKLQNLLTKIIKNGFRLEVIHFYDQGCFFNIDMRDINYIDTDTKKRKVIIHMTTTNLSVNKSLKEMKNLLDYRFEYSHRGCIINKENTLYIDTIVKIIKFKNGDTTTLLSPQFIKQEKQKNKREENL